MSGRISIFYGAVVNPQTLTSYDAHPRCLLAVGPSGNIEWMEGDVASHDLESTLAKYGCNNEELIELKEGEFLLPGFVDTHTLLDWLANVTFPMEAKFKDTFINAGTTTACYYATLHVEASKALADTVLDYGQRGFIGKCNMNHDCPSYYTEDSPEDSISNTRAILSYIRSLPAFMAKADPGLLIQTHISENPSEVAYTNELFPEAGSYAGIYDQFGLLREGTILAHAVHLTPGEVDLIQERGAGISHCPTSNFNLRSGIAPVGKFLDKGIKVGLGTDVSGGFSTSILGEIQHASMASKVLQFTADVAGSTNGVVKREGKFENKQLPIPTLLYLATLGGASLCKLEKHIGSFAPGKSFDALIVSPSGKRIGLWGSGEKVEPEESVEGVQRKDLEEWLERFLFCGDDRNIDRVYVQGRWIGGRSFAGRT
ncbi:guanine deaminase [Coprinellus micaceus]|uniref:Guanine deaminase n=1 Tax=Coprinellus micaceus TaxID=71717 RepID=A0A4Y7TZR2_COPMI|nr:guanine deaminase [Coprinellus micaceus]